MPLSVAVPAQAGAHPCGAEARLPVSMIPGAWLEVKLALAGCWHLVRGDPGGLRYFDRSRDGFWRSFRAAVLAYPLFLVLLTLRISAAQWHSVGGWRITAIETISYVIGWTAFPLIVLTLTRRIGALHRYFDFMVAYNWSQLPESGLFLLVGILGTSGVFGDGTDALLGLAAAVAVFVYEWFVARVALDTSGVAAAIVVSSDLLLSVVLSEVAASLY